MKKAKWESIRDFGIKYQDGDKVMMSVLKVAKKNKEKNTIEFCEMIVDHFFAFMPSPIYIQKENINKIIYIFIYFHLN